MVYFYLGVLGVLAALAVLSAKEPVLSELPVSGMRKLFRKMAVYLYRQYRRKNAGSGRKKQTFPGSGAVRADLDVLDPVRKPGKRMALYYIGKIQNLLVFVTAADLLAIAVWFSGSQDRLISDTGVIERPPADGDDLEIQANVSAEGEEGQRSGEYTIQVSAREYSEEETDAMAKKLFALLPDRIRGGNRSLLYVTEDLDLVTSVEGFPFRIRWDSSRYEFLDDGGRVGSDRLEQGTHQSVGLTAEAVYRDRTYENEYLVEVYPAVPTREESFDEAVAEALSERDAATSEETLYYLPEAVSGVPVVWTEKVEDDSILLFVLTAAAGVAVFLMSDRDLHRKTVERERQMALDYPQIVSKMVLLAGTGMSISNALARIGKDYVSVQEMGGEKHYAYEEILLLCRELESGISENSAIQHFGKRCRSRRYARFCSILAQNQRKGNAALLPALQAEAEDALNDRKNIARQLGEEAGTKLLLPMVMMLAVTLVIIVIPAFFSFSI